MQDSDHHGYMSMARLAASICSRAWLGRLGAGLGVARSLWSCHQIRSQFQLTAERKGVSAEHPSEHPPGLCKTREGSQLTWVSHVGIGAFVKLGNATWIAYGKLDSPSLLASPSRCLNPVPKGPTLGQHHRRGFVPRMNSILCFAPGFCITKNNQKQSS